MKYLKKNGYLLFVILVAMPINGVLIERHNIYLGGILVLMHVPYLLERLKRSLE